MSAYRNDLEALEARRVSLAGEVDVKRRELDDVGRMIDDAKARAKLPVLDNIRVAAPCAVPWDSMQGTARVRHCADCDKQVFNLSDMTRDEAEALIIAKNGNLCVSYFRRKDGTVLLADCELGAQRGRRRRRRLAMAGAAAILAGGVTAAAAMAMSSGEPAGRAEETCVDGMTAEVQRRHADLKRARHEAEYAAAQADRTTGVLLRPMEQLGMTVEEMEAARDQLEAALKAAEAGRARADAEGEIARARTAAIRAEAEAAAASAAQAQRELEEVQHRLEVERRRVEQLERALPPPLIEILPD